MMQALLLGSIATLCVSSLVYAFTEWEWLIRLFNIAYGVLIGAIVVLLVAILLY